MRIPGSLIDTFWLLKELGLSLINYSSLKVFCAAPESTAKTVSGEERRNLVRVTACLKIKLIYGVGFNQCNQNNTAS